MDREKRYALASIDWAIIRSWLPINTAYSVMMLLGNPD